jgi:hypothetical protein
MSFKALVIFLLILIPATSRASTIYSSLGTFDSSYVSGDLFFDPSDPYMVFNPGTITSVQLNSLCRDACASSGADQTFTLYDSSTPLDCKSETKANNTWGFNGSYGQHFIVDIPMSGSQCEVTTLSGHSYYIKATSWYSGYFAHWSHDGGYISFIVSGGGSVPPDTSTHIIDFTPADHATLTGPTINFTMHAYVNPDDIGTYIGVKFTLHNIDQNVLLLSAFSPGDIYLLDGFNATTSGDFYFATTSPLADGNYRLEAQLERSYLGGWIINPFSPINQDISHQFIVGSSTFIGNMSQNGFSELQAIFASTTATSTTAVAQNCNPLGSFDVVKCGAFLFIPGGDYLDTTLKGLKAGVLTRVPWGYLTRTYNIWTASATTSLPSFTASVRTGPGDDLTPDVTTITIDPGDMIAGAGTLLDDTRDPIYNKNAKDVFGPLVQLVLAVSVIFTIIADLTGSHRHHADVGERQTKLS